MCYLGKHEKNENEFLQQEATATLTGQTAPLSNYLLTLLNRIKF